MAQAFDVCIRGAGIVGHSLALLLAQQRLRVALVRESLASASTPDVRAYALNTASRQLLQGLRCWPEGEAVTPVTAMRVLGDAGAQVNFGAEQLQRGSETDADPALAWIIDVPALEASLAHAIRFQPMIEVCATAPAAALTVVCEGRFSSTRAELGVEVDVAPYGQHAIAARLRCAQPHGGQAVQWFADGEILALLPLDGPQGNLVALVWSVSEPRMESLCALDEAAFAQAVQAAAESYFGDMALTSARGHWPLQRGLARHWCGRTAAGQAWVLAGDAAHAVHPLAGQGLNLGLADVAELASVLEHRDYWRSVGDLRLLRRYERARRAGMAPLGAVMDGLQRLFSQPQPPLQNLRRLGMLGFERSGAIKTWVVRQAMGTRKAH